MKSFAALEDCRALLAEAESIDDVKRWRPAWIALLSQLRAVGAVLWLNDRGLSPSAEMVVTGRFTGFNSLRPRIFWEFIKCNRELALLEYKARTASHAAPFKMVTIEDAWRGRLCVDVAREAIAWWDAQLRAIAKDIASDIEQRAAAARRENYAPAYAGAYPPPLSAPTLSPSRPPADPRPPSGWVGKRGTGRRQRRPE